jgi:hypothetical protein
MPADESPVPDNSRLALRIGVALGALTLLCIVASALVLATRPPPLRTHRDLVAYGLSRQGVVYREIALGEMWPDNTNRQYGSYAGPISMAIRVQLGVGGEATGWIECAELERSCELSLKSLGIDDMPLPDMADTRLPEWLRWLEEYAPALLDGRMVRTTV